MWILPQNLNCSLRKSPHIANNATYDDLSKNLYFRADLRKPHVWKSKLQRSSILHILNTRAYVNLQIRVNKTLCLSKVEMQSSLRSLHFSSCSIKDWELWRSQQRISAKTRCSKIIENGQRTLDLSLTNPLRNGAKNTLVRQTYSSESYKGLVNPRWVECLMGLPIGWVQLSNKPFALETPLEHSTRYWPTPSASQRGDTLVVYLRRSHKRFKNGADPFAIPLLPAIEAALIGLDLQTIWDVHARDEDTEAFLNRVLTKKGLTPSP